MRTNHLCERPEFFRLTVCHAGKKTTVSMDFALHDLLSVVVGGDAAAKEWIKERAYNLPPLESRCPSLSRRIQVSVLELLWERFRHCFPPGETPAL